MFNGVEQSDLGGRSLDRPLFPHVGVLALVPDEWQVSWQVRHYVLTQLAHYFRVIWVNPALEWRQALKQRRLAFSTTSHAEQWPGLTIYTPEIWLSRVYKPSWLARLTYNQRLNHAYRLLTEQGCQKIILYLWRPEFEQALLSVPFDLSCYHIDDEYSFSFSEIPLEEQEARLIHRVDQVFIHSQILFEKKGGINPHTALVPNGVDYQNYACVAPEPPDLVSIPRPRIGYTGRIKLQLDWIVLFQLSLQHPEWSFVFVGPIIAHPQISGALEEISSRPNVYFLGCKSAKEVATYPQHFDVCIMPYLDNGYTKYIYPLKLHEYLASGRPTVGTRIRSLEPFADVVTLVNNPDQWSLAIVHALSPSANTDMAQAARQRIARQHDWKLLVRQIAGIMLQRLAHKFPKQFSDGAHLFPQGVEYKA